MRDRWSDDGAAAAVAQWGEAHGVALALRTYTSRLIGAEPDLVLHGGGNTSVKDVVVDALSDEVPALFVKGSGWDLATIAPQGFTPVDLAYMRRMRALRRLSDEAMVEAQRTHRLRDGPDPSIETLLHAFLPHAYVDHSHADAIIALTNRRDGIKHVRDALGEGVLVVPYVKAGFELAKVAADWFDDDPDCIGMVLMHHGLFTFGATAEQSYRRHIQLVAAAERYLTGYAGSVSGSVGTPAISASRLAPVLRGALSAADPKGRPFVLAHRPVASAWHPDLASHAASGPLTPDHVLRTKPLPLYLQVSPGTDLVARVDAAVQAYVRVYDRYFEQCAGDGAGAYVRLDPVPRVVWVQDVGLFGVGTTMAAADVAADIAEHTVSLKQRTDGLGAFVPLTDEQLFEMEYWSLEQRKLGKTKPPLFEGRVALVTGAAGAIGAGVLKALLAAGAHVVATDLDPDAMAKTLAAIEAPKGRFISVEMDVTDSDSVREAFDAACAAFGGVDVCVVNAGVAVAGLIAELSDEAVWGACEVNFMGALRTMREAAARFAQQRTGGDVVLVSTKNVAAPGAAFGAYSATKAAAHQLARVAALEFAPMGVRVNLVAPDAVFSEGTVPSGLWQQIGPARAKARGMTTEELPAFYAKRNLLGATVTGAHVGAAVVFLASGQVPTTGAVLPVDGGLPEAFPR